MQYTISIDQTRALEWGLSLPQAMLFDYLTRLSTWASAITLDGQTFFHFRRTKLAKELPLVSESAATFKRHIKGLCDIGVIEVRHVETVPYLRVTQKGGQWNQIIHPGAELRTPAQNCADPGAELRRPPAQNCATISTTKYQDTNMVCVPRATPPVDNSQQPIRPEVVAAVTLRRLNVAASRVTAANPDLIAAVGEGVTPEALADMAILHPDKPAGYIIAACRRQNAEQAKPITSGESHANRSPGRKLSACERTEQRIREERAKRAGVARIA